MADIATLGIRVTSNGINDANRGLRDLEQQGARTEGATNRMSNAFGALKAAIAAVGVGVAVREFVQAADQMSLLNARLKLSTSTTQEFAAAQRQLFSLAQQNSVGLAETIQLYTRLAEPIKRVGGGMNEVIGITDTFQKALQLGGVTAQEAASATLQFGQALGRGALSGDEFNSIAEASPRILKAIADGANLPIEKLKQLGAEGKLTSDVIGNALLSVRKDITQEFASLPDTVGKATERMKNDFLAMTADINNAGGFTQGMAEALDGLRALIPPIKEELIDAAQQYAAWWERNSAEMGVVFDHVTGIAGKAWDLARAAAEVAGTISEWALQSGAVSTVLETLHVLAVNIAYIFRQIGIELGGMAAQAAAVLRLDFDGAAAIGEMMRADAAKARAEVDALSDRILNARQSALEAKSAIAGVSAEAAKGEPAFKKLAVSTKDADDATKAIRKSTEDYGKYLRDKLTKDLEAARKAQDDLTRRYAEALGPLEEHALQLERELETYGKTEAQIARTTVQRYEEVRALAAANGASADYLKTLDLEIAARKRIAEATAGIEVRRANEDAARDAADEWQRTADDIERTLTDALMRGFESGEDFAENFRDVLINMFKTLVLRPIIQPIAQGMSGFVLQGLGMGAPGGGATDWFGMARSGYSMYSNSSIAAQYFGGTMSGANALGTMYGNATGTGLDGLIGATGGWGTAPYTPGLGTFAAGIGTGMWAYNQTGSYTAGVAGGALGMAGAGALAGGMGAAAAGTGIAAGAGAGAMGALAAIPGWGWAALAGAAILGDLFGDEEDPRLTFQMRRNLMPDGIQFGQEGYNQYAWEDAHKGFDRVTARGAFGNIGLHIGSKDVDAHKMTETFQNMAAFDDILAQWMTAKEIEIVRSDMDGWMSSHSNRRNTGGAMTERYLAIAESLGLDLGDVKDPKSAGQALLNAVRVDDLQEMFGRVGHDIGREAAMAWMQERTRTESVVGPDGKRQNVEVDGFTELAAAAGQMDALLYARPDDAWRQIQEGVVDMFEGIGQTAPKSIDDFRRMTEALDLSTDAGRDMYLELAKIAPAFMEVANAVQQAFDLISQSTASTIESFRMDVMSDQEKYAYYDQRIDDTLSKLDTANDPNEILSLYNKGNTDLRNAWALLSPEEKKRLLPEFEDRAMELEARSQGRLSITPQEDAKAQGQAIGEAVKTAITETLTEIGNNLAAAGSDQAASSEALRAAIESLPDRIVIGSGSEVGLG